MEKIDKTIEVMEGRDARSTKIELNRRKIDELVDWINENEEVLVIIADWCAGKEKIFDKIVAEVDKQEKDKEKNAPRPP